MNTALSKKNLRCTLMPAKGRFCQPNHLSLYHDAFQLWFTQMKAALAEENNHDIAKTLTSNGFMECDEFAVICDNHTPIGIFMFRWLNLNYETNRHLQEIQYRFPKQLLQQFENNNITHLMTMGNLVVDPAYRRHKIGFGIADILMGFALSRFLESDAQILLTTTRNNRSTNKLCYRQGGTAYDTNNTVFGVASDVVLFERQHVIPHPDRKLYQIMKELWQTKDIGWINMPLNFIGRSHDNTATT